MNKQDSKTVAPGREMGREKSAAPPGRHQGQPTQAQKKWLQRGLTQAGGKLPLFDEHGKQISSRTVKSCIQQGWAVPWFENPIKPDWLICKLTEMGREVAVV